jgi:hypothetical protein
MYIIGLERQLINDISLKMYGGGGKETGLENSIIYLLWTMVKELIKNSPLNI